MLDLITAQFYKAVVEEYLLLNFAYFEKIIPESFSKGNIWLFVAFRKLEYHHILFIKLKTLRRWTLLVIVKDQSSHLVYLNICIK